MKRIALAILIALIASAMITPVFAQEIPRRLVLGMVPSREADRMIVSLEALAKLFTERLGIPVEAYVSTNFTGLVEAMGTRRVDIGIFGPTALVLAEDRHKVQIILASIRRGATSYRSQFLTLANSGINSVKDLKGKTIAFVDPASASGFVYPYGYLIDNGINPEKDLKYVFAGAHDAAAIAVLKGDVHAAVSFEDVRTNLVKEYPKVMETLKVFAYTNPIPNDGVAVRAGLDQGLVKRIQQAFIDLGNTEQGRKLFDELYNVTGFAPAESSFYDVVRRAYKAIENRI